MVKWNEVDWIFRPEGLLRDIYVKYVELEDWASLIDYLNQNYQIKYGVAGENKTDLIDKEYSLKYLVDETGEMELKTGSIFIGKIMINLHFFSENEIEFDIDPKEINSNIDLEIIIKFMNNISQILDKEVILSGENESEYPLIEVNYNTQRVTIAKKNC